MQGNCKAAHPFSRIMVSDRSGTLREAGSGSSRRSRSTRFPCQAILNPDCRYFPALLMTLKKLRIRRSFEAYLEDLLV